jgi:hypothetical protein
MSESGHFRQIDPLPTLSACPLRFDRVRTFAPQRIDAVCHKETSAARQKGSLFDDLIGRGLQDHRNSQAKRLGGREIDH